MQKTRKTYYANGTGIGDAMIHRGIYYLNGAEATTQDWTGKPSDWSDIRKDCPANSIALYAGHTPLQQWTLGDRLDNKATFVGYFDSVNPDTNTAQRYAYFVLDGNYRSYGKFAKTDADTSGLANMTANIFYWTGSQAPKPIDSTLSGTWVMSQIKDLGITDYPLFDHANNISVSYNGNTYTAVVPNTYELKQIWENREAIDAVDPSTENNLTDWIYNSTGSHKNSAWTCAIGTGNSSYNTNTGFFIKSTGVVSSSSGVISDQAGYVPIIEIPIDNSNIQYDNLGFTATCTGGYNVFIDGTQYGSTYASGSNCTITWSSLALTTGDDITTPSAMKAHKIWIEPATSGNNITFFRCRKVAESGNEEQCVLWAHFATKNFIQIRNCFCASNDYDNKQLVAITAKNNKLFVSTFSDMCRNCENLEYVATLIGDGVSYLAAANAFSKCYKLTTISLKDMKISNCYFMFERCGSLQNIKNSNVIISFNNDTTLNSVYTNCVNIKNILPVDYNSHLTSAREYIVYAKELEDTDIDMRGATNLNSVGIFGSNSDFINGLKSLRVSNEAPFNYSTQPQIRVDYTGLDRNALVQLFNDLPYNVGYEVVGSPTISSGVVSGFTTSDYTKTSLSLSSDNEKIRIKIRFKTPETFVSGNTNILTFGNSLTTNNCIRIYTGSSYSRISSFGNDINTGLPNLQTDTFYVVDVLIDGNKQYSYLYDDNNTKLAESANTTKSANFNNIGSFGGRFYSPIQAIDFNNTSIEVNDVYWFRGQPAMTKTLSCVGATGTAYLTAEDKDIALNKGWSLTLS